MTDHAALLDEIAAVRARERDAFNAMWRAMREGTREDYNAALDAWRAINVEHAALIRAGVLTTLGPLGEPRDD